MVLPGGGFTERRVPVSCRHGFGHKLSAAVTWPVGRCVRPLAIPTPCPLRTYDYCPIPIHITAGRLGQTIHGHFGTENSIAGPVTPGCHLCLSDDLTPKAGLWYCGSCPEGSGITPM